MTRHIRFGAFLLLAALTLPPAAPAFQHSAVRVPALEVSDGLLARGGGRGGGGSRSGGSRGGGRPAAGSRGGGERQRGQTGFQNAGSGLNRGERRPSGGWSSTVRSSAARPSLTPQPGRGDGARLPDRGGSRLPSRDGGTALNPDRNRLPGRGDAAGLDRGGVNRGDLNRGDLNRGLGRDGTRTLSSGVNRNWNRTVNIGDVNLNPGWARPGWGIARPWNTGWYGGWVNPPWGWWGARAAVWGVGTLATAAMINSAVDAAINSQESTIVVPDTSYQLLYGSVVPSGNASVSFAVTANGNTYQLTADCQAGTINGQDPASAAEAQLLNAACQVAFGST